MQMDPLMVMQNLHIIHGRPAPAIGNMLHGRCSEFDEGRAGKMLRPDRKTFEVHVEKGMRNGSKIVLRGEAGLTLVEATPDELLDVDTPAALILAEQRLQRG